MKKTLITILVTVLLCGCVFGTTFAWLMDKTDTITNTFTYGNIDITLTESENLDLKMMPGKTITKNPKITVKAGSEACYLFVKIDASTNYGQFFEAYAVADGWTALAGQTGVYYRSVSASTADQEIQVLAGNSVKVLDTVTQAKFDAIKSGSDTAPTLAFTAYAVQSEGVADAPAAWAIANPTNNG